MIPSRHIVAGGSPPRLPRRPRLGGWKAGVAGLVAGVILATGLPAGAAWLVNSSGTASVQLAKLEPVEVGKVTLDPDAKALPGKRIDLVASTLGNPNGVTVSVLDSDLKALESDDADCKASLGKGVKYTARDAFDLKDGQSEDVVLGTVALGSLANTCQGATLTGTVSLKVGYGDK